MHNINTVVMKIREWNWGNSLKLNPFAVVCWKSIVSNTSTHDFCHSHVDHRWCKSCWWEMYGAKMLIKKHRMDAVKKEQSVVGQHIRLCHASCSGEKCMVPSCHVMSSSCQSTHLMMQVFLWGHGAKLFIKEHHVDAECCEIVIESPFNLG